VTKPSFLDWLEVAPLRLWTPRLAMADPTFFPGGDTVDLEPGLYQVRVAVIHEEGGTIITALRVCRAPGARLGVMLLDTSCEYGQLGVCDYDRCAAACKQIDAERVIREMDAPGQVGVIQWCLKDPESRMPYVRSGWGSGPFPVYELSENGVRQGIEISFRDENEGI
jgi:hypothetical protein